MEVHLLPVRPQFKLYKDKFVVLASFLGGPMAAGYLIAENYRNLGQRSNATRTWIIAIAATFIIYVGMFIVPGIEKVPNMLIPLVYSGLAQTLAKRLQGEAITTYLEHGGEAYSTWRIVLVGLLGLIVSIVLILIIVLLLPGDMVVI